MNAYELAYKLNNALGVDYEMLEQSSIMLRQQADRIAELEKGEEVAGRFYWESVVDGHVMAVPSEGTPHYNKDDFPLYTAPRELSDGCGNCHACLVGVMENNIPVTSQRMIVCSDCGNKRCPKASNHRHKCTGSNEVGQYGSIYTAPRELSDDELNKAFDYYCETDEGVLRFNYELRDEWKKEQLIRWKEAFKKASEK
jgi:hypothetical protein